MLVFSQAQLDALSRDAEVRFEHELAEHLTAVVPALAARADSDGLSVSVRIAIDQAKRLGFTQRGPLRFYAELSAICGQQVAADIQFGFLGLPRDCSAPSQLEVADRVFRRFHRYLREARAHDDAITVAAIERHLVLERSDDGRLRTSPDSADVMLLVLQMHQTWPEAADFLTPAALELTVVDALRTDCGLTKDLPTARCAFLRLLFGRGWASNPMTTWLRVPYPEQTRRLSGYALALSAEHSR